MFCCPIINWLFDFTYTPYRNPFCNILIFLLEKNDIDKGVLFQLPFNASLKSDLSSTGIWSLNVNTALVF